MKKMYLKYSIYTMLFCFLTFNSYKTTAQTYTSFYTSSFCGMEGPYIDHSGNIFIYEENQSGTSGYEIRVSSSGFASNRLFNSAHYGISVVRDKPGNYYTSLANGATYNLTKILKYNAAGIGGTYLYNTTQGGIPALTIDTSNNIFALTRVLY